MSKQFSFLVFFLLNANILFAQEIYKPGVESFEAEKALNFYNSTNGKLSITEHHKRFGKSSLQWDWQGESFFGTAHFKILSRKESPLIYGEHFPASPTLQMSIYNETPKNGKITISYEKEGAKQVWFDMDLSFSGWRRIWVPFFEMKGHAPKKGVQVDYDYFKISTTVSTGKLFFDDIVYSQYQDDRHPYPDLLVPFIKAGKTLSDDHWMPLVSHYNRIKNFKPKPISASTKKQLEEIEQLINKDLSSDKPSRVPMSEVRKLYDGFNIRNNGKTIVGPPLTYSMEVDYFDKKQQGAQAVNDLRAFGTALKKMSIYYNRENLAEKKEIETMFLASTRYYLDQGWQAGSNGGTRHHVGYSIRDITEAFFSMRELLAANGLLGDVGNSLHWLYNLGLLLDDESSFHVNIDYLNTQSYYHLMLIFLFDKPAMQAELLSAYSNYLSITLAQQNEEWGYKVDGTAWHHNGHYPAYALGSFKEVPRIFRMLSGTQFRISPEAHKNFKNAFLATRTYSQRFDWGFGNAGRHPLDKGGISTLKQQFLDMAYAGNPEGTAKIDREVAAAYLRLWGKDDAYSTSVFTKANGIQKEEISGYYTFPLAATAVHRRNDWAAIIKGYSKYVWASEIYVAENRYGRYPANGTVQLLNSKGEKGSGFRQEGWDWNRYPGSTIIYLPLKELEAKMPLIMFRSNETFAGTTTLNGNGIFGMVINEDKGANAEGPEIRVGFPGKLGAKKSVFSYGDKLIYVGTNISSIDTKNATQTNLFQTFLTDTANPITAARETITKFPYDAVLNQTLKDENWLIDPYGNGYHLLSTTAIHVKKAKQQSYHNTYSVNTGKVSKKGKGAQETEGDFASAWIDHGFAPKSASYQYVVYPFLAEADQKNFGVKVKSDDSFAILRADETAHIVLDKTTNTTGYVIFEANKNLDKGVLKQVSAPALVMINQKNQNSLTISAVQPDLNFPLNEKGKLQNYSKPVELKITIEGKWKASPTDFIIKVDNAGANTTLTLICINGLPREFQLSKL